MLHIEVIIDHWPAPTPGRVTGPHLRFGFVAQG
jgi:hypothetical protein